MDYTGLIIFAGFIAFMYAFIIRPQQQRQKQIKALMESLAPGDDVGTIGGIHGRIISLDEETVLLRIAEGTDVVFDRSSIGRRIEEAASEA